jgi:hypothetical protein
MTEHDAPTVARATLWLDTSSETSTRRARCLEDSATLAFERPALEPATAAPVPATATVALDGESAFAAFEASATRTLAATDWSEAASQPLGRRKLRRSIASHALAMMIGAASVAFVLGLGRSEAPVRAERVATPSAVSSPPAGDTPAQAPAITAAGGALDRTVDATLSGAVEALARGDYGAAHILYGALAVQRPHDGGLVAVAAILADRIEARCTVGGKNGAPCGR